MAEKKKQAKKDKQEMPARETAKPEKAGRRRVKRVRRPVEAAYKARPSPQTAPFHSQDTSSYATALSRYSAPLHPAPYQWCQ